MAIVLVEQHLELALAVADYAYVVDRGPVALEGPSASVRGDARLLQYLAPDGHRAVHPAHMTGFLPVHASMDACAATMLSLPWQPS